MHDTLVVRRGGLVADIDVGLAGIVERLWYLGVPTLDSCENCDAHSATKGRELATLTIPAAACDRFVSSVAARSGGHPDVHPDVEMRYDQDADDFYEADVLVDALLDRMFDLGESSSEVWPPASVGIWDGGWAPRDPLRAHITWLIPVEELPGINERLGHTLGEVGEQPWVCDWPGMLP